MTFAIGFFDLFTYAIPGAFQLTFVGYVLGRLHLINIGAINSVSTALLVIGAVVASYVLGHITYAISATFEKAIPLPLRRPHVDDARRVFVARVPDAKDQAFVRADYGLLRAAVELHNQDVATEITRLTAVGLMVRNVALPLTFGFVAALVEIIFGTHRWLAACTAVLLLVAVLGAVHQGRKLRLWANMKTLELSFWVPDINDKLRNVP